MYCLAATVSKARIRWNFNGKTKVLGTMKSTRFQSVHVTCSD